MVVIKVSISFVSAVNVHMCSTFVNVLVGSLALQFDS